MLRLISTLLIVLSSITMSKAEIIQSIEIKNNVRVSKQTIVNFGKIELGKDYNQEKLNQILLDLYSTNFFSDIKFDVQGDVLVVEVDER